MTHVELLTAEKMRYVEEGKEKLDKAAEWLHMTCGDWSAQHEEFYVGLVNQAATCLNKAIAINEVLIKLGVN